MPSRSSCSPRHCRQAQGNDTVGSGIKPGDLSVLEGVYQSHFTGCQVCSVESAFTCPHDHPLAIGKKGKAAEYLFGQLKNQLFLARCHVDQDHMSQVVEDGEGEL